MAGEQASNDNELLVPIWSNARAMPRESALDKDPEPLMACYELPEKDLSTNSILTRDNAVLEGQSSDHEQVTERDSLLMRALASDTQTTGLGNQNPMNTVTITDTPCPGIASILQDQAHNKDQSPANVDATMEASPKTIDTLGERIVDSDKLPDTVKVITNTSSTNATIPEGQPVDAQDNSGIPIAASYPLTIIFDMPHDQSAVVNRQPELIAVDLFPAATEQITTSGSRLTGRDEVSKQATDIVDPSLSMDPSFMPYRGSYSIGMPLSMYVPAVDPPQTCFTVSEDQDTGNELRVHTSDFLDPFDIPDLPPKDITMFEYSTRCDELPEHIAAIMDASPEDIAKMCRRARSIRGPGNGRLKKLSDKIVLKTGMEIGSQEFVNRMFAYHNFDRDIFVVPQPYRDFEHPRKGFATGYLVMEYVKGQSLDRFQASEIPILTEKIAEAVEHLHSQTRDIPGPVDGDTAKGYPWLDYGAEMTFQSREDLEFCLNRRLSRFGQHFSLENAVFVFCHLDLASRNVVIRQDRKICILD